MRLLSTEKQKVFFKSRGGEERSTKEARSTYFIWRQLWRKSQKWCGNRARHLQADTHSHKCLASEMVSSTYVLSEFPLWIDFEREKVAAVASRQVELQKLHKQTDRSSVQVTRVNPFVAFLLQEQSAPRSMEACVHFKVKLKTSTSTAHVPVDTVIDADTVSRFIDTAVVISGSSYL